MIQLHKLKHAVALAQHRNFRQAAEGLNLTQPALSRSIQSLESALGVRLFDRGHGRVESTALGTLVVELSKGILSAVADLEREVELAKGLRAGTLEVSLAPYPSSLSGQRAVARLQGKCVDISIYSRRRDMFVRGLKEAGYDLNVPQGAFYMMADFGVDRYPNALVAAEQILENVGVATVPGAPFYADSAEGESQLRFCFAKSTEDLEEACRRLRALAE